MLAALPLISVACNQRKNAFPENGVVNPADDNHALASKLSQPAIEILTLAARAPSGHNTQPWTIRLVSQDQWILGIDASRRLSAVDPTARETLLSLGAFLENLLVAAAHYGYGAEYQVVAHAPVDSEVLELRMHRSPSSPQPLDSIRLRRTIRNGLLSNEIRSADLASILGPMEDFHYFPRHSAQAKYLSEGTLQANKQQAARAAAVEELSNWIRWSGMEAQKYRNGLTPASLEIEGVSAWYVSHFFNHNSVLSKSFKETTVKQVEQRVGQGGGWLVVECPGKAASGTDSSIASLIETGRRVERMWLQLRERKIAIHPMTQMLEESPWSGQIAKSIGIDSDPQFLLRIGYVDRYPEPASLRMPAAWFTH